MNILDKIICAKHVEIDALPEISSSDVKPREVNIFKKTLFVDSIQIIAEIKPASPSEGKLVDTSDLENHINAYKNFASAVSVLTDNTYFGGSYSLLDEVQSKTLLPALQKDFILSEKQIIQGVKHGASAVLLIVKLLDKNRLQELISFSKSLNMEPVIEVNNREELSIAIQCGAEIILINNRDFDTLKVNLETTRLLAPRVPENTLLISASGYSSASEIQSVSHLVKVFLIGSSLMKTKNPHIKLKNLCPVTSTA